MTDAKNMQEQCELIATSVKNRCLEDATNPDLTLVQRRASSAQAFTASEIAAAIAAIPRPAAEESFKPVEIWHGERKVTIDETEVLRIWGSCIDTEMSSEPRTHEAVNEAVDWLYKRSGV